MIRRRFNAWYDALPEPGRFLVFLLLLLPYAVLLRAAPATPALVAASAYVLLLVWLRSEPAKRGAPGLNVREYVVGREGSWFSLSRYHIGTPGRDSVYMRRWICHTPWGSLRLHHILRSDADRDLHDHPMSFWTFLLTGDYAEVMRARDVPGGKGHRLVVSRSGDVYVTDAWWVGRDYAVMSDGVPDDPDGHVVLLRRRFSLRFVRAETPHRLVLDAPVWTVVLAGPKRRRWGFHVPKPGGGTEWVDARTYLPDTGREGFFGGTP